MRARYPDTDGYVERDGVKVFYEVYGEGEPTILLMPTWPIVHSRLWKGQIPYLARHFRVVTFDARGNGRSDRPRTAEAYGDDENVADALAVLDATGTSIGGGGRPVQRRASGRWSSRRRIPIACWGLVAICAGECRSLTPPHPWIEAADACSTQEFDSYEGWAKENRHYWLRDWPGYAEFFLGELLPEPHSTKALEDAVSWARETDAETMLLVADAPPGSLHAAEPRGGGGALPGPDLSRPGDRRRARHVPAAGARRPGRRADRWRARRACRAPATCRTRGIPSW